MKLRIQMKYLLICLVFMARLTTTAQTNAKQPNINGRSLYCLILNEKYKDGGHQTSLNSIYSYLFKIELADDGTYLRLDRNKENPQRGKYKIIGNTIELLSDDRIKTHYTVSFRQDKYITLMAGDTTYYCLIE